MVLSNWENRRQWILEREREHVESPKTEVWCIHMMGVISRLKHGLREFGPKNYKTPDAFTYTRSVISSPSVMTLGYSDNERLIFTARERKKQRICSLFKDDVKLSNWMERQEN